MGAVTRFLAHRDGCPACGGRLLFQHCNPCHRLFVQCERCEAVSADVRAPIANASSTPEHPVCPRCDGTAIRPATRSDLEVRGLLDWLQP
ncbi:MAG TPA: hypothetical protein V6D47_00820 [Oscillatoriaceae cyanobacterium]